MSELSLLTLNIANPSPELRRPDRQQTPRTHRRLRQPNWLSPLPRRRDHPRRTRRAIHIIGAYVPSRDGSAEKTARKRKWLDACNTALISRPTAATLFLGDLNYGNGVDLDKLAPVAKHRDAQQGARRVVVAEPGAHHVPGCDEVRLVSARNVDGRPHDVCQHSPCRLQRHLKIVHDLPGLPGDVTERYNPVVLVDRTRAGGVHKPGTGGNYRGVGIRDSIGQAAGTDQFHRHDADDATSAARHTTEFTAASAMRTLQIDRPIPPSLAALYADHQAVDPIAKAALVLTHFEHQYLPC